MVTLYGWGPMFDCPSPSPFVMKSEIQLQMLGVEFDRKLADLESVPKRKAPYVIDGETLIEDSNFIRAHFEKKLGKSLDTGLSGSEQATAWAMERMVEGHLRDYIITLRWLDDSNFNKGPALFFMGVPAPAREEVMAGVRADIAATHQGTGFGRFTDEERLQMVKWDLAAIRFQLGDKPFLFGNEPVGADATIAAFLISASTKYFESPLPELILQHDTLVEYMKRMTDLYFATSKWPVPEMA